MVWSYWLFVKLSPVLFLKMPRFFHSLNEGASSTNTFSLQIIKWTKKEKFDNQYWERTSRKDMSDTIFFVMRQLFDLQAFLYSINFPIHTQVALFLLITEDLRNKSLIASFFCWSSKEQHDIQPIRIRNSEPWDKASACLAHFFPFFFSSLLHYHHQHVKYQTFVFTCLLTTQPHTPSSANV